MRMIATLLLLCLIDVSVVQAQDSAGYAPPLASQTSKTKFIVLLGPDLKPGEKPFLDPYEMSRQPIGNMQIPAEAISVDVVRPLPTTPGVSVQVGYPAKSMDPAKQEKLTDEIRSKALRFGITQIEFAPSEGPDAVDTRVRVGLSENGMGGMGSGGLFSGINLAKYVSAAAVLNPDNPTIELFDERPLRVNQDGMMGMEFSGGGMTMDGGGMDMGMGAMSGYGGDMAMGGYEEPAAAKRPRWAEAEGTVTGSELVVSWSLEKKSASAISLQSGGRWVPVKLSGEKMTQPIVEGSICAFYCDDTAFAFSAKVGRWDTLQVKSPAGAAPPISSNGQSATIKTDDDLHIFTAVSGRWASRSQAANPNVSPVFDPFGGNRDPFGGSDDPFGGGGDPFASAAQAPDPFGPAEHSSRISGDPFGGPSAGKHPADPFAVQPQALPSQDPFDADRQRERQQQWRRTSLPSQDRFAADMGNSSISDLSAEIEKLRRQCEEVDANLQQHAKRYNETTDEKEKATIKQQLADIVTGSFNLKSALQTLEVQLLAKKFSLIGDQFRLRERHRDALIQQRIEELTAGDR